MAITLTTALTAQFGNNKAKVNRLAHSGATDTSQIITPGIGFTTPIGGYTDFTLSGNTFTFTIVDGAVSTFSNILFLGP